MYHEPVYFVFANGFIGNILIAEKNGVALSDKGGRNYRIQEGKGMVLSFFFTRCDPDLHFIRRGPGRHKTKSSCGDIGKWQVEREMQFTAYTVEIQAL